MIAWADIWIGVLGGAAVTLAVSLAFAILSWRALLPLRRVRPSIRTGILMFAGISPFAGGLMSGLLIVWSPHALPFDLVNHHCHANIPACASHARAEETVLLTVLGLGLLVMVLMWICLSVFEHVSQASKSHRLLRLASKEGRGKVRVLRSDRVLALSSGLLNPAIFISEGLLSGLDKASQRVVIAHEHAHGARRDALARLVMNLICVGHLPQSKNALLQELELAQEQSCDAVTARYYGPVKTAETLLQVERLKQKKGEDVYKACLAFGHSNIEARTRALIHPDFKLTRPAIYLAALTIVVGVLSLIILAEPVHHEIETLFLSLQD